MIVCCLIPLQRFLPVITKNTIITPKVFLHLTNTHLRKQIKFEYLDTKDTLMQTSVATVSISGNLKQKLEVIAAAEYDGVEIFENAFKGT